jgi:fructose transport system ATP-binding protein
MLPVVLIRHDMPQMFELAARIHIHRLGRRAVVVRPGDASMSQVVSLMTGALRVREDGGPTDVSGASVCLARLFPGSGMTASHRVFPGAQ